MSAGKRICTISLLIFGVLVVLGCGPRTIEDPGAELVTGKWKLTAYEKNGKSDLSVPLVYMEIFPDRTIGRYDTNNNGSIEHDEIKEVPSFFLQNKKGVYTPADDRLDVSWTDKNGNVIKYSLQRVE